MRNQESSHARALSHAHANGIEQEEREEDGRRTEGERRGMEGKEEKKRGGEEEEVGEEGK